MTDKQIIINTNKYFIELTDIGGGTNRRLNNEK